MKKTMLVMAVVLLAVSSCKKKDNTTTTPGGSSSNPQIFSDYFPGLNTLKEGAEIIDVTSGGKPGTISYRGMSFTIWPTDGKKYIISSSGTTGWSYYVTITDPGTGNESSGVLGEYQYFSGKSYYMLSILQSNSSFAGIYTDTL